MRKFFIFLLLSCSINLFSQTTVSGIVSGTWNLAGSPYMVQGAIMVANNTTLTIDPGVQVKFQGSYKFLVLGTVLAIGTSTDSITFTATNTTVGWLGIKFDNTASFNDTSRFSFCKIEYGRATDPSYTSGGAFYFNNFSKVVISHSRISNCTSNSAGGAIYCNNSGPKILYNNISGNSSDNSGNGGGGGAMWCDGGGNITVYGNIISYNTAHASGGGIACFNSSGLFINNTISYNSSFMYDGGGISCWNNTGSVIISNNTIIHNYAYQGAGITCWTSNPTITQNNISFNSTPNSGGGIYCTGGSNPSISYNSIFNNSSASYGGGIALSSSNPDISNNVITNNFVSNGGGGISCMTSSPTISNCTIANNFTNVNGGGLFCISTSNPNLTNCVLYGNKDTTSGTGMQIYLYDEQSDPNFYYCNIQGGQSLIGTNTNVFYLGTYSNNINSDPLFVSPTLGPGTGYNGSTANWSLTSLSPCLNSGSPSGSYPANDIAGNPRVYGGRIDIGAFEYQGAANINELNFYSKINVYPNPTTTSITISGNKESSGYFIADHLGRKIIEGKLNFEETTIDLKGFESGIYYLKTISDNKTFKIVKGL